MATGSRENRGMLHGEIIQISEPKTTPQPSIQQTEPSEGQPNWPARIQERPNTGGNKGQGGQGNWSGGPHGNWSSGGQPNWTGRQQEGNWGYRHQGHQSRNSGRQPNNQVVSYIPPHQRGNQQHQGNQPYHQPQYQSDHYGPSDYPQPSHGGGSLNQRYNRQANEGPGEAIVPHHQNDAMREIQEAQKEQRAALDMLTKQLSQVAMSLGELRGNEGKIPATVQPTGRENISVVSLRSGKVYQSPTPPASSPVSTSGQGREEEAESNFYDQAAGGRDKGKGKVCGETLGGGQGDGTGKTKPYPYRGMITRKRDATIDVASLFKDVEVKVPLLTSLKMPPISKFVKDYLAGKVNEEGRIITEENVSAVIQRSDLPSKKTDPWMFTLPISIGGIQVEHAMCDLGASINVLSYSIYKKLGEAKLVDTDVMIQLADRSCIHPEGILEDVIVKVNNFLYPADFFVIKMTEPAAKESSRVLLGKPFMSTASTIIDVCNEKISLDFKGEQFAFNIDEAMKRPTDSEKVYSVDVTEPLVQEYLEEEFLQRQFTDSAADEEVEMEIADWYEAMKVGEIDDQAIAKVVMDLCEQPRPAGSSGIAQLSSLEKLPT
ncbi:uncharacterized protein LOC121770368 [Salvia splendens]|uniref:uncharacterized protein LOC121770368 n=1 Tax=Salvia splendens TaxID=180675 RepID=UPI001C269AFF|nr:uncharacterized protein LOC121770368 [Salvia splendens]